MIKKGLLFIVGFICYTLVSVPIFAQDQELKLIHTLMNIENKKISDAIMYTAIFDSLDNLCTPESKQEAMELLEELEDEPAYIDNIHTLSPAKQTLKFISIKNHLLKRQGSSSECGQYYFLVGLMQRIQNTVIPLQTPPIVELGTHQTTLNLREQAYALFARDLIQNRLSTMHTQGLLTTEDLTRINGKIILDYSKSCNALNGSYQMSYTEDNKTLDHILLHINICEDDFYLGHFKEYIDQLLIHELGHYFYYFRDKQADLFSHICRPNRILNCSEEDFISKYSMTNQEEDYAEHFMYWYIIHFNPNQPLMQTISETLYKKMWHFTTLFNWEQHTTNDSSIDQSSDQIPHHSDQLLE